MGGRGGKWEEMRGRGEFVWKRGGWKIGKRLFLEENMWNKNGLVADVDLISELS